MRGDQSAEVLDLRMTCLEGPRGALKALTDVFSRADATVLIEGVNAAQALPALERCADVPALRAVVPRRLTRRLCRVSRSFVTGSPRSRRSPTPGSGQPRAARQYRLVETARAIGYEPLLAEALAAQAWLEIQTGESVAATQTLEAAVWAALVAHRDDIAAESAANLVATTGYLLARREEAEQWEKLAEALLRRLGPGHDRAGRLVASRSSRPPTQTGRFQSRARRSREGAVAQRKALPPSHPDIAITLLSIAIVQDELGNYEAALEAADKAVEIYRNAYGHDSPQLAQPLGNRGESYEFLGRYPEAERDLRLASELSAQWVGPDHQWTAIPLTALGKTLILEHHFREATPILERALRIREKIRAERRAGGRNPVRACPDALGARRGSQRRAHAGPGSPRDLPKDARASQERSRGRRLAGGQVVQLVGGEAHARDSSRRNIAAASPWRRSRYPGGSSREKTRQGRSDSLRLQWPVSMKTWFLPSSTGASTRSAEAEWRVTSRAVRPAPI